MDLELRHQLRQAEQDGNYQKLYVLLQRAGRSQEAQDLILDHPIRVECEVQYRYRLHFSTGNYNDYREEKEVYSYTLDGLVDLFVAEQVGASRILYISRNPVYFVLEGEIEVAHGFDGPHQGSLRSIHLDAANLLPIKDRIKAHPHYMKSATTEALQEVQEDDERDAEVAGRLAAQQALASSRQQREQRLQRDFDQDSLRFHQEVWDLWSQHHQLERPKFARQVGQHPLRCVLYRLKDLKDLGGELVTKGTLNSVWVEMEMKRFLIYRRDWNAAFPEGQQ